MFSWFPIKIWGVSLFQIKKHSDEKIILPVLLLTSLLSCNNDDNATKTDVVLATQSTTPVLLKNKPVLKI